MKRSELVKTLELVYPALSATNLVPVFTCFMFKQKSILAYNDVLGIVAKGGIGTEPFATAGVALLGLLQNSHAEEVDFQVTEENVIVKTGKSIFKLPYFTEDQFIFDEPKEKWAGTVNLNEDLLKGIEICLTTSSRDQSKPAIMGVCFNFDLVTDPTLFSCDGDAITRYKVGLDKDRKEYKNSGIFTVPNVFCDALLKISSETETTQGKLELNQNWAKATLNNGFTIYGRMIVTEKNLDHQLVIDQSLRGKHPFAALPVGLSDALASARVLADPESATTAMTVDGSKLQLVTDTHMGVIRDELKIKGHEDVEATVHASLVHRSLTVCDQISIRENVTAYKLGNTVLQIVSNIGD
jgi:DNA polymerase III sliding clamp (beta) subunit (PCNA family)